MKMASGDRIRHKRQQFRKGFNDHILVSRKPDDSRAFQVEEKFDTWLDLKGLQKFQTDCHGNDIWLTAWMKGHNRIVCPESIIELHSAGIFPADIARCIVTPTVVSKIIKHCMTIGSANCYLGRSHFRNHMETVQQAAMENFRVQFDHLTSKCSETLQKDINMDRQVWMDKIRVMPAAIVNMWKLNEDLMKVFTIHRDLNSFVDDTNMKRRVLQRLKTTNTTFKCESISGEFTVSKDIIILRWLDGHYLFDKNLFLELLNKTSECLCYLVFNWMQSGTNMPHDQYQQACKFLIHITTAVSSYQRSTCINHNQEQDNKGYVYLKAFEGLAVAHIIHIADAEKGWVNTELMQSLWTALRDDGIVSHSDFFDSPCYDMFASMQIEQLADLVGCVKLAGHPSIEVEKGLRQLYDRTHAEIRINDESVQRSIGVLTRDLFKNFFLHHKRYPLYNQDALPIEHPIRQITERNVDPNCTKGLSLWNRVTHDQWSQVQLIKNAEFDPVDNQLTLLKDKALGFRRNKIWPVLVGSISDDKARESLRIEDRRSLLSFLISPSYSQSFSEYLRRYEDDDPWLHSVLDYLVIKLTPKEKEFKPGGRMFGASPQEERNRRIVQEMNTMRFMDAYTPDQLLTTNELTTLRKLVSFRYFGAMFPDHVMFQVSFDFSKWNNSMRKEVIDVAGAHLLDRWFGRHLWGRTMQAYENALIYYTDRIRKSHWEGQLGGIEGLSQATWSYVFIGGVKSALERIGAIYQLTVKGDDVRAAIAVPRIQVREHGYEAMKQQILGELQNLCNDMGWQLNPQETFVSLSLIATSKQYQVNDTWLPAASKKIYKMMSHANLVFPTLEDTIGSVFSCAHSACSQTTVALPAFASAVLIACREIYRECSNHIPSSQVSIHMLAVLSLWPQVLGGPGSLPLQTFFVRGENDILSVSISLLRYITVVENNVLGPLAYKLLNQKLIPEPDMRQLVADPYSLCVNTPERPASVLRRLMRESMTDWVGNQEIKMLLSSEADTDAQALINHLLSMEPFCNKVITLIWECSPFYIIDEILSKFMQSSSVFEFLKRGKKKSPKSRNAYRKLALVLKAADDRMRYWIKTLTTNLPDDFSIWTIPIDTWTNYQVCTTELVHRIRAHAWGKPLVGITYPSLVDQNWIYHEHDVFEDHPLRPVHMGALQILVNQDAFIYQTPSHSDHYASIPRNVPWVGSRTATTIELPKTLHKVSSPTLSKVMKLIALRRGGDYLGRPFVQTIDNILSTLTSIDLTALVSLTPEAGGGHIPHRAAINSYSLSTMPNYRPNLGQIARVNPDGTFVLAGDTSDRTINYAARHYYSVVMALFPLQTRLKLPDNHAKMVYSILHWDINYIREYRVCPWCCNIITDQQIVFLEPLDIEYHKYQEMAMVGASEFEEKILSLNLQDVVHQRAKRVADLDRLDYNAPIVREIAACMVLRTMNSAARKLYDSCRGANYARIPTGYMAEIMAVVLGHKHVKNVSLNVLRAIAPKDLYLSLLNESLYLCLEWYKSPDTPIHDCIQHVMRHLNPMEPLFRNILGAGLAQRVSDGYREISEELAWDHSDLEWRAGDTADAHKCSKSFLKHHVPILDQWIKGSLALPRLKCFLGMEDDDAINEAIDKMAIRCQKALYYKIVATRGRGMFHTLINELCRALASRLNMHDMRQHDFWTHGIPEEWAARNSHVQMAACIAQGLDSPDNEAFLEVLSKFFLILNLDEVAFLDARREVWMLVDNVKSREIQVIARGEMVADPWLDNAHATHTGISLLINRHCHVSVLKYMKEFFNFRERNRCYILEEIKYLAEEILLDVWPTIDCINYFSLGVMTNEDAERVLRSSPDNIIQWLEDQRVHERYEVGEFVDVDVDIYMLCNVIGGQQSHRVHLDMHVLLYRKDIDAPENNLLMRAIPIARPFEDVYIPRYDWIDLIRCAGHQNTSVCKFAEIFDQLGTLDIVNDHVPNPVVLCLADGIGGLTAHMLRTTHDAIVFYNSLQVDSRTGDTPSDASVQHPPIETMASWVQGHHRSRLRWKGYYPGDLCSEGVVQAYIHDAKLAGNVALITCDADRQWDLPNEIYHTLVINITKMAIELLVEVGQCIIKMFLVDDYILSRLFRFIQTHFEHFHVIRCHSTRSHSTEVFLTFGCVRDRQLALSQVGYIQQVQWNLPPHLESEAYIMDLTANIMETIMLFREEGQIHNPPTFNRMFEIYQMMGLTPLSLSHLMSAVDSDQSFRLPHLCQFPAYTLGYCAERKQQMFEMIEALDRRRIANRRDQIRRPKRIVGAGGTPIAHGWSIDDQWIRNYLVTETIGSLIYNLNQLFTAGTAMPWEVIQTNLEREIFRVTESPVIDVTVRYDEDMHLICVRGQIEWDMTLATRRNGHRAFRIFGSFLYMTWLTHHHREVADAVIRDWIAHADIRPCCTEYCAAMWNNPHVHQVPMDCPNVVPEYEDDQEGAVGGAEW